VRQGRVLILGERHLRKVLAEYARHYNGHRPHHGLQQESPLRESGQAADITARIERGQVLGGVISEYRRAGLAGAKRQISRYKRVSARHRVSCVVFTSSLPAFPQAGGLTLVI
jgi:hypothetical protein